MTSALAITWVYNEVDILSHYVRHQVKQGVEVFLLDNWSDDGSHELGLELSREFPGVQIDRWPDERPGKVSWFDLLQITEDVALDARSTYRWCMHQDVDEFTYSPRAGETLIQAYARVEAEGYNAIDHSMYLYQPIDRYDPCVSPVLALTTLHDRSLCIATGREIKAWIQPAEKVELCHHGGHDVTFPGLKVHPELFIKKHYPYRTWEHKRKKIASRVARWAERDTEEFKWHSHYNDGTYP